MNLVKRFNFLMWLVCFLVSLIIEGFGQLNNFHGLGIITGLFLIYAMYHDLNLKGNK